MIFGWMKQVLGWSGRLFRTSQPSSSTKPGPYTPSGAMALHMLTGTGGGDMALRCEAVRCLVAKGASLSAREARGSTPLLRAAGCSMGTLVQLLLQLGADPNERRQSTQRTAWDMANIPGWDVESYFFWSFLLFQVFGVFNKQGHFVRNRFLLQVKRILKDFGGRGSADPLRQARGSFIPRGAGKRPPTVLVEPELWAAKCSAVSQCTKALACQAEFWGKALAFGCQPELWRADSSIRGTPKNAQSFPRFWVSQNNFRQSIPFRISAKPYYFNKIISEFPPGSRKYGLRSTRGLLSQLTSTRQKFRNYLLDSAEIQKLSIRVGRNSEII